MEGRGGNVPRGEVGSVAAGGRLAAGTAGGKQLHSQESLKHERKKTYYRLSV